MTEIYDFDSGVFPKETIEFRGVKEAVVRGGRHLFNLVPKALVGVRQIGVIGWGGQAQAQSMNLRDTLSGSNINVKIGLRAGSSSERLARECGFTHEGNTLGEMFAVIRESQLIILLTSDASQVELHDKIFAAITPGSTLGFSHGFLAGHLKSIGKDFPTSINVIGVCPKGMGPSVRRLYVQGEKINGAGINSSFAVHHDLNGLATSHALAWSVALGSPYTFQTTLESEYKSDVFGERGILLGAVHGIVERLYLRFLAEGMDEESAFINSCESVTGPISKKISKEGIRSIYSEMNEQDREIFERMYVATYPGMRELLEEIYDEVSSGNELNSVILGSKRLSTYPMSSIDSTPMWEVGRRVRAKRGTFEVPINPLAAGAYLAVMMAQVDVLLEGGHPYSEIANESVIECVDSLNPYMHARGVAYMVDNCSTTARLGARKWAPRFDYQLYQSAFGRFDSNQASNRALVAEFKEHMIHDVLKVCASMRPSVDIFVE